MDELRRVSGKKIDAIMRVEAAGATLNAFMVASKLGIPVVDTCLSARARPGSSVDDQRAWRAQHRSQRRHEPMGRRRDPSATLAAPYRSSHILRALAVGSGGVVTTAGTLLPGSDVKRATIKDSVSQAILWGRTVREAVERKVDPIDALTTAANGYKLFHGIVAKDDGKGDRGYTYHDVELKGINEFAGHAYKIWVKNENIVTWLDGKPDAMSPDFISNLDPKTGDAITGGEGLGGYPGGQRGRDRRHSVLADVARAQRARAVRTAGLRL